MSELGTLAVGTCLGAYRVMGHVVGNTYRAVHVTTGLRALIEVAAVDDRDTMRSQRLQALVYHPGIARIVDRGVLPDHRSWVASEAPSGIGLYEVIARRVMPVNEATVLIRDIADVLAHAHAHDVVHRALTLRSIIVRPGGSFPLCVCDWGLRVDDLGVFGAPELTMGGRFDGRVDIFALGVIAFRAVTRRFPGESGIYDVPHAPAVLATLIARMLAVAPSERPTAAEVLHTAGELLGNGDDIVLVRTPRFSKPKWTPAPTLVMRSDRVPTTPDKIEDPTKS